MKDFPVEVDGPLGPWYQKVNKIVAEANMATTAELIKTILGDPDTIETVPEEERISDESGKVDRSYPDTYFEYADPYRPSYFYRFGLVNGTVIERARQVRIWNKEREQGGGGNSAALRGSH